jgi:hypothetical protein
MAYSNHPMADNVYKIIMSAMEIFADTLTRVDFVLDLQELKSTSYQSLFFLLYLLLAKSWHSM